MMLGSKVSIFTIRSYKTKNDRLEIRKQSNLRRVFWGLFAVFYVRSGLQVQQ